MVGEGFSQLCSVVRQHVGGEEHGRPAHTGQGATRRGALRSSAKADVVMGVRIALPYACDAALDSLDEAQPGGSLDGRNLSHV